MNLDQFIETLNTRPESITFDDTISLIDSLYEFTPAEFTNGDLDNEAGQNNGSCKIFAFGRLHGLSKDQTLHCFGDFYRKDVLENPGASDHQNIRNFMKTGWQGIHFHTEVLHLK